MGIKMKENMKPNCIGHVICEEKCNVIVESHN